MLINGFLFYFLSLRLSVCRSLVLAAHAFLLCSSNACANDNDNAPLPISIAADAVAAHDYRIAAIRFHLAWMCVRFTPLVNTKYLRQRL